MPFVTVKIARGHSIEKKRRLVEAITHALVAALDTKPEWITIHIDEFERESWAVNGELLCDRHRGRHDESGR